MNGKNGLLSIAYHTLFVGFMTAPLMVIIMVSFTDMGFISFPKNGLSLRWFQALLQDAEMVDAFLASIRLALIAATLSGFLALLAALAIARYSFPGRSALTGLFLAPLMIPHVVLGVAFLRFFAVIDVTGSFTGLLLAHVTMIFPYSLRLTLAAVIGMEQDAERAAQSLGAGPLTILRRIVLPLILPGVTGGWILSFIQSFDELTMTAFVATPGTTTLPVAMYSHITYTIDPMIAAISSVLILGTVLLMVLLDRAVGLNKVLLGKGA